MDRFAIKIAHKTKEYIVTSVTDAFDSSTYFLVSTKNPYFEEARTILHDEKNAQGAHVFWDKENAVAIAKASQIKLDAAQASFVKRFKL